MLASQNVPFVCAKDDEASYHVLLRQLVSDAGLRRELGAANRAHALTNYDQNAMFQRYRALYGNAMQRADFSRQS
jgi:hypothetical protein